LVILAHTPRIFTPYSTTCAGTARVDVAEKVWVSSCDICDIPPAVCFFMPNRECLMGTNACHATASLWNSYADRGDVANRCFSKFTLANLPKKIYNSIFKLKE